MGNLGARIETIGGRNEILASYPGAISSVQVQVSDEGLTPDEHGKKILKAGTIIGGIGGSVFEDGTRMVARSGAARLTTALVGDDNDLDFAALTANATTVAYVDPVSASATLSVAVSGNNITVNLATDADGKIVTTANDIKNLINSDASTNVLIEAKNVYADTGNGVVTAMPQTALTSNANVTVADGVLFNDVDLTYGPRPGALIVAGNINANRIPAKPTAVQMATMPRITFMDYQN